MRVSPQKARLVLDLIKGRRVEDALQHAAVHQEAHGRARSTSCCSRRSRTRTYLSTEKGLDVDLDKLYVKSAVANDGPRMKRIRPAPWDARSATSAASRTSRSCWRNAARNGERVATVVGEERRAAPAKQAAKKAPAQESSRPRRRRRRRSQPRRRSSEQMLPTAAKLAASRRSNGTKSPSLRISAWATPSRGSRAGLSSAITTSCCSKT